MLHETEQQLLLTVRLITVGKKHVTALIEWQNKLFYFKRLNYV